MELRYDERVDAASVYVYGPIAPGGVDYTERLDQDRNVKYDKDDRTISYEFLNVRRYGVRLDDLEHREELARLFRASGFSERDWGAPLSALRPRERLPRP